MSSCLCMRQFCYNLVWPTDGLYTNRPLPRVFLYYTRRKYIFTCNSIVTSDIQLNVPASTRRHRACIYSYITPDDGRQPQNPSVVRPTQAVVERVVVLNSLVGVRGTYAIHWWWTTPSWFHTRVDSTHDVSRRRVLYIVGRVCRPTDGYQYWKTW